MWLNSYLALTWCLQEYFFALLKHLLDVIFKKGGLFHANFNVRGGA